MSVSQYRFQQMPIEKAKQIVAATRAAIKAHQAGGLRSDDPKVRADVNKMPLNQETFEDRLRAHRRLQPVVNEYERAFMRGDREEGLKLKAALMKEIRAKRDALDRVVEENRRRRLARERDEAKKAGYR